MHTFPSSNTTLQQLAARAALHDAAKSRAVQLRQQAIDDFWSAIGRALRSAADVLRKLLRP